MDKEAFKTEVWTIRTRHRSPLLVCRATFDLIRRVVSQLDGEPVTPEFKRLLRETLDDVYHESQKELGAKQHEPADV